MPFWICKENNFDHACKLLQRVRYLPYQVMIIFKEKFRIKYGMYSVVFIDNLQKR